MAEFEPKKFGRYLLIDKLAVGGMAEIYKAKTYGVDGFEKLLAIKRILPHCAADSEFITMLVDEAKLTVLLSHANIVQVYDLGKVGDDYYISMEFINGTNLRELMRRVTEEEGKIPEELAVYVVSEICKGLDYAHRKVDQSGQPLNIVHRDINPQNILISYEGEVKIVDFGIAKAAMNVSHTMAGVLKGKIAYMSPEQALGKPLDGRTDIYSTGLVLYEMLTGEKLFTGETQFEVLNKIRTTRINTLDLPDDIPGLLKAIVAKALAYNAKDRYQSAGDLHLELTKYLYSSYIDFSPRQLASLVKKYFGDELKAAAERGPQIDEKTRSLLIKTGAMESLVSEGLEEERPGEPPPAAPEVEPPPAKPEVGKPHIATDFRQEAPTAETERAAGRRKPRGHPMRRMALLGSIAAVLVAGFAWYQLDIGGRIAGWFTKEPTPETAIEEPSPVAPEPVAPPVEPEAKPVAEPETPAQKLAAITVSSEPSDAKIILNGTDTGQTTPATLTDLLIGQSYKVEISKEHYKPFEKSIDLNTEKTVKMHGELAMLAEGILEISSEPAGAQIFLNGKDTGQVTPSTLKDLAIEKDYDLELVKDGYEKYTDKTTIKNFDPVQLKISLKELPKPPPEPPPIPMGSLEIRSTPGSAKVFLNGKDTGQVTPTQLEELELDKFYTVALRKDGYDDWTKSVKVRQETGDKLVASLVPVAKPTEPVPAAKPAPKPAPTPTRTTQPAPTPAPQPTYTPTPAPAPTRPATLQVSSSPSEAQVYINGQFKGNTPLKVSGLPAGYASVEVKKYGYMDYRSSVNLQSGEAKNLGTIKLQDAFGELKVESRPPRAEVYFDGDRISTTPVTIKKVPRNISHTLTLQLSGYYPQTLSIDMSNERNKTVSITLQKQ